MLYKPCGDTGKQLSAVGMGCMRFENHADIEANAQLIHYAYQRKINYFDTAPYYCDGKSEDALGLAVKEMTPGSFYLSTKSMEADGDELRRDLDKSLQKLGVEKIDFFYIWCLKDRQAWEERLKGGAVDAALKAREEGLIEHLGFSTHMRHGEVDTVLKEDYFEGVTLGYNAINFPLRQEALNAAHKKGLGVVTMNPLGGGVIPQNAQRFDFLRGPNDPSVVSAALRFNISQPAVTSALVGFSAREHVDQAVQALEDFSPYSQEQIESLKSEIEDDFDGLCTGCGYCEPCPVGIEIPRFMDAYNMRILKDSDEAIRQRLKMHWRNKPSQAGACIECGQCEDACTQHLPIIERLKFIASQKDE